MQTNSSLRPWTSVIDSDCWKASTLCNLSVRVCHQSPGYSCASTYTLGGSMSMLQYLWTRRQLHIIVYPFNIRCVGGGGGCYGINVRYISITAMFDHHTSRSNCDVRMFTDSDKNLPEKQKAQHFGSSPHQIFHLMKKLSITWPSASNVHHCTLLTRNTTTTKKY